MEHNYELVQYQWYNELQTLGLIGFSPRSKLGMKEQLTDVFKHYN